MPTKHKTADYTRKAVKKYDAKFDRLAVRVPIGYKELIREKTGKSFNAYINGLIADDLKTHGWKIEEQETEKQPE